MGNGASFAAGAGSLPTYSDRTFGYQAPQYFLTSAAGPWGTLDWTYDKIGNRLSESRDGGATADAYVYTTNAASGDTPDPRPREPRRHRHPRLHLGRRRQPRLRGPRREPRRLHLRRRKPLVCCRPHRPRAEAPRLPLRRPRLPPERHRDLRAAHLPSHRSTTPPASSTPSAASRPPPIPWTRPTSSTSPAAPSPSSRSTAPRTETWTYLTTDHLGTPLVATDQSGAITWEGGFEPFGTDYQAGMTAAGASENGIDLRLPGQWVSDVWADATSGAGIYYNVWRLARAQTGRFTDGRIRISIRLYRYAGSNVFTLLDVLGLYELRGIFLTYLVSDLASIASLR